MAGTEVLERREVRTTVAPLWHVLILDDDYHTFGFVIDLFITVFRKDENEAIALTEQVHHEGAAIGATCSKERAELYCQQVARRREGTLGPIGCRIEPA